MPEPAASPAPPPAKTHGWAISMRYLGRTIADRSLRGADPVTIGEDPACTVVVPGLGDALALTRDDEFLPIPGLTGLVFRDEVATAITGPARMVPGDRAELQLTAHPEITLELRRHHHERLPLGTLINFRELARQLALGAGLLAGLALLIRNEAPVNTLEIKGEPDAPVDSLLVRAMFAVEVPVVPVYLEPRFLPAPPPDEPPAAIAAAPLEEVAPLPLQVAPAEAVPVPVGEVDAQPRKRKRNKDRPEMELSAIGALYEGDGATIDNIFAVGGVEGGVLGALEGGVVGGVVGRVDVLAELKSDAPTLGVGGGGIGYGVRVATDVPEVVEVVKQVEVVDSVEFVENIMGPGAADDAPDAPVLEDMPRAEPPPQVLEVPVPGDIPPPPPGASSHAEAGTATVVNGVPGGVAAVAPESRCEDPTLSKKRQLDVVFVVDVSTTMTFMLDRIEQQIAQVDLEARAEGLDTRYGLVVFVDDVKLGNNGQPYADLAALRRDLATWQAFTAGNREINSAELNLDWPENTLDAVHAAASQFAWRPADATLRMIVHATDDDFGEAPTIQSGQAIQHDYAQTVSALRGAEVRMFSFAAKVGGQCECLDVRPGLFTRFRGKPSLPDATGGAVFDIDEVASRKLSFAAAVGGAIKSGVCTRYPLSPFGSGAAKPR